MDFDKRKKSQSEKLDWDKLINLKRFITSSQV
jgi:hypothetical protein